MDVKKMKFPTYLGDSVYVGYDGYHIWLNTQNGYPDDPRNAIALEPEVYRALLVWFENVKKELIKQVEEEEKETV